MKVTLLFAALVAVLVVTGCGRQSLTLDKGSRQLAPVLGPDSKDLQYFNHAVFAQIQDGTEKVVVDRTGTVAVTSSELILAEGAASSITEDEVVRILISDIEGVAMAGPFVQLVHGENRYVILPYRWYIDTVDMAQLNALSELLASKSVPAMAPVDFEWTRRIIHNAEGAGVHIVNSSPRRSGSNTDWDRHNFDAGNYNSDGTPRDSQAFTPWQEWGN